MNIWNYLKKRLKDISDITCLSREELKNLS